MHLPQDVRQLLAELELLSHGTTQSWNPSGSHTTTTALLPPGEAHPPHVHFRLVYLKATTVDDRADVLDRARDELRQFRGHGIQRPQVDETGLLTRRILEDGIGESVDLVARALRCTPTAVRRVRLIAGLSVETGRLVEIVADDVAGEARRMRENGMSVRAIALALGKSKSTIHDWLR